MQFFNPIESNWIYLNPIKFKKVFAIYNTHSDRKKFQSILVCSRREKKGNCNVKAIIKWLNYSITKIINFLRQTYTIQFSEKCLGDVFRRWKSFGDDFVWRRLSYRRCYIEKKHEEKSISRNEENGLFRVRLEDWSMYTNECIRMLKNDLYRESEKNDSSRMN